MCAVKQCTQKKTYKKMNTSSTNRTRHQNIYKSNFVRNNVKEVKTSYWNICNPNLVRNKIAEITGSVKMHATNAQSK